MGEGPAELSMWELLDAPRPARRVRELPGLLVRALRFAAAADRGGVLLVVGVGAVTGLASGVQVLATQRVLAELVAAGRVAAGLGQSVPALAVLAAVGVLSQAVAAVQVHRREVLTERLGRHAQQQVLGVTTRAELADFDDPVFHDRVQRASHGTQFGPMTMVGGLAQVVTGVLGAAGLLVALATISPPLVALVVLGIVPVWAALQANGLDRYRFVLLDTPLQRRRGYLFALLTGRAPAKEVRAYGLVPELLRRWRALGDEHLAELRASVHRRARRELVGDLLGELLAGLTLLVLAWMLTTGRLSLPQAGAAGAALLALRSALGGLALGGGQLFEAALFVADYEAFLAVGERLAAEAPTGRVPPAFGELTLEDVTFRYPGAARPALDGVRLSLRSGEVVALVGENGSGKTTLAKLLAGLYAPTAGRITWDGVDVAGLDRDELRRRVAVVFQDFERYALTARENVAFGDVRRLDDDAAVREAARRAGADGPLSALPQGYDTQLGRLFGGSDLSVGQWQRVALARAFYRAAPLVVLDEPTAALDARAEHDLFARIRELYANRTVLLVSHRFSTVRTADRIVVLHRGEVVESGDHDSLLAARGRYAEMFTLQASAYRDGDA